MFKLAQLVHKDALPQINPSFTQILNSVFVFAGAIAFLMIVIGGFRYTIAGGDANKVAEAKRQVTFAGIGIIVVAMAAAIVNFALSKV